MLFYNCTSQDTSSCFASAPASLNGVAERGREVTHRADLVDRVASALLLGERVLVDLLGVALLVLLAEEVRVEGRREETHADRTDDGSV